jgi:polygalacturonase
MRLLVLVVVLTSMLSAADHDVHAYGAIGDGTANDTAAIQRALDDAMAKGGGTVTVSAGTYRCGTIHLRSRVTLHLANGAVLLGSPNDADFDAKEKLPYPVLEDEETQYFHRALVTGEDLENVAITGEGVIDGNRSRRRGPKTLAIKNSRHISIRGITVRNSPNYSISLLGCEYVDINGVTVLNSQADGIDPDNCRFVRISNCYVESRDDAICPKASLALGKPGLTEHLVVTNCITRTNAANFKLGTESAGVFRDIVVSNLVTLPRVDGRHSTAGFEISMVDGGTIENVAISNVTVDGASAPFFIRLGNRGRGQARPEPGALSGVTIDGLIARGVELAASITGLSSNPVRDISLRNIMIEAVGGRQGPTGFAVPELAGEYPKAWMFGHLPVFGLYARHVEGLTMRNVRIFQRAPDARPPIVFDDVSAAVLNGRDSSCHEPCPIRSADWRAIPK